jgi:hypothetical protein
LSKNNKFSTTVVQEKYNTLENWQIVKGKLSGSVYSNFSFINELSLLDNNIVTKLDLDNNLVYTQESTYQLGKIKLRKVDIVLSTQYVIKNHKSEILDVLTSEEYININEYIDIFDYEQVSITMLTNNIVLRIDLLKEFVSSRKNALYSLANNYKGP